MMKIKTATEVNVGKHWCLMCGLAKRRCSFVYLCFAKGMKFKSERSNVDDASKTKKEKYFFLFIK